MTDAVADYGLRLELTRVLLQLRDVQLRALDDPVYRALVRCGGGRVRDRCGRRIPLARASLLLRRGAARALGLLF